MNRNRPLAFMLLIVGAALLCGCEASGLTTSPEHEGQAAALRSLDRRPNDMESAERAHDEAAR